MEEDNFTQKESLELISRMIKESRTNIEKGGGNAYSGAKPPTFPTLK